MRKIISTFIFAITLLLCHSANATQFIDGMEDVPLPDGMTQITQDDFSFGNEETRLLEAYLTESRVKRSSKTQKIRFNKIGEFYQESLPQLGWIYQGNRGNDLLFYRDGETLEVVRESVSPLIVRITVKTKP